MPKRRWKVWRAGEGADITSREWDAEFKEVDGRGWLSVKCGLYIIIWVACADQNTIWYCEA